MIHVVGCQADSALQGLVVFDVLEEMEPAWIRLAFLVAEVEKHLTDVLVPRCWAVGKSIASLFQLQDPPWICSWDAFAGLSAVEFSVNGVAGVKCLGEVQKPLMI